MTLDDGYVWGTIAGLVVVVFATRNAFVALPRRWLPTGAVERALRFAPLAALVALTVPAAGEVLLAGDGWIAAWHDGRLPAAAATVAVARWARSPFPGLAAGVVVLLAIGGLG